MTTTTYHTYPDLLIDGGRHAATEWTTTCSTSALLATLRRDPDAVILRVVCGNTTVRGLAPGGLGA
jgi:hypothetical protein